MECVFLLFIMIMVEFWSKGFSAHIIQKTRKKEDSSHAFVPIRC